MNDIFDAATNAPGFSKAKLSSHFDVERDTPDVFEAVVSDFPAIVQIVASLRCSLPLAPHARIGAVGGFVRIPNHYRSVACLIPSHETGNGMGAIVFKGTEPLLPDFSDYLEWMLTAPFRGSYLPLGLHFPLEMKLPPGAMWIEECVLEQDVTSRIQSEYLAQYGRLARLPVPLFVFELGQDQVQQYRALIRARVSAATFSRIEAKLAGGLGVEVYYYPSLPVRAADLFVTEIRTSCASTLTSQALEETFGAWIRLMADMLHLGYMPYAPWNHGMGACVDPGNACIDGGFNDVLTIVPFDSIPSESLFWRSLGQSIQMLASSVGVTCAAAAEASPRFQPEPPAAAVAYVTEALREHIRSHVPERRAVDPRLLRFFERPAVEDIFRHQREAQRERSAAQSTQFSGPERSTPSPAASAAAIESNPQSPQVIGV